LNVSLREEVVDCHFGDQRLTKRLDRVVTKLGEHPTLSIPAALGKEIDEGYEFFANENVTPEKILSTHRVRVVERILQEEVCLLVQDKSVLPKYCIGCRLKSVLVEETSPPAAINDDDQQSPSGRLGETDWRRAQCDRDDTVD